MSRILPFTDRDVNLDAALDPSSAQYQLWLAQIKRDHGNLSDQELNRIEQVIKPMAKQSKTLYNPFTGEIRKVEF